MAKTDTNPLYVVLESFTLDVDGVPTAYRKGEPIHPDDPVLKSHAKLFGPFTFPHPIPPRVALQTPEVRAELSFGQKMAAARAAKRGT